MLLTSRVNSLEALHYDPRDATANIRMRRSAGTASNPTATAQFTGTDTKKLRLFGDLPNYLKASPGSTSLSSGPHSADDPQFCFKMHKFQVLTGSSTEGGVPVVIETNDGRYVTKDPANSEGVTLVTGNAPQQTQSTDDRFFRMYRDTGDQYVYLKHLHSGMHLSADQSGVSLHSSTDTLPPSSTLFKEFGCTHT